MSFPNVIAPTQSRLCLEARKEDGLGLRLVVVYLVGLLGWLKLVGLLGGLLDFFFLD